MTSVCKVNNKYDVIWYFHCPLILFHFKVWFILVLTMACLFYLNFFLHFHLFVSVCQYRKKMRQTCVRLFFDTLKKDRDSKTFKTREWMNEIHVQTYCPSESHLTWTGPARGLASSSLLYPGCYFDSIITEGEISCLGNRRGAAVSLPRSDRHPGVCVGGTPGFWEASCGATESPKTRVHPR